MWVWCAVAFGAPSDGAGWAAWAEAEKRAGHLDAAVRGWQQAVALRPEDADGYGGLGGVLWDAGRVAEAFVAFDRGLALDPADEALATAAVELAIWGDRDVLAPLVGARFGQDGRDWLSVVHLLRDAEVPRAALWAVLLADPAWPRADADRAAVRDGLVRAARVGHRWRYDGVGEEPVVLLDRRPEPIARLGPALAAAVDPAVGPIAVRVGRQLLAPDDALVWDDDDPVVGLRILAAVLGEGEPSREFAYSMAERWPDDVEVVRAAVDVALVDAVSRRWPSATLLRSALARASWPIDASWHTVDRRFVEWVQAGRWDDADALVSAFIGPGLAPTSVVWERLGWLQLVRGQAATDDRAALVFLGQAVPTHPHAALWGLAQLYLRHGQAGMAEACLRELWETPPGPTEVVPVDPVPTLVRLLVDRGRPEEARLLGTADVYEEELRWAALAGRARRGEATAEELREAGARADARWGLLGGLWLDLGRPDEAFACYLNALERGPVSRGEWRGAVVAAPPGGLDAVAPAQPEADRALLRVVEALRAGERPEPTDDPDALAFIAAARAAVGGGAAATAGARGRHDRPRAARAGPRRRAAGGVRGDGAPAVRAGGGPAGAGRDPGGGGGAAAGGRAAVGATAASPAAGGLSVRGDLVYYRGGACSRGGARSRRSCDARIRVDRRSLFHW